MDDDLLADDGQFKDDGLYELDIDEEAALLGLSDEEIERDVIDQELEYVDEDGNPVEIGESNAELYEVADIESEKRRTPPEDILELDDLDAEIESFTQENSDILTKEPPAKTFNERKRQDNLISLTSHSEREKYSSRRKESHHSPERTIEMTKSDNSYASHSQTSDPFSESLEYDEESEDENVADDHRERFKSERSNIITLTPAKKRTDIPDTLESVISVEETAKVEAFLENEQRRKMRFKGKSTMRMKNTGHYQRSGQSFSNSQSQHHQPQFSSSSQAQTFQGPPTQSQSRKILINPHFRGVRLPPPPATTEQVMPMNPVPPPSVPSVSYEAPQNYAPPVYSHHDNTHQININPPVFTAPPPIPYKPPEYSLPPPPQQHIQQAPPPIWQQPPPEIPPSVSYATPPPPLNYVDPMVQVSSYHNNYNTSNFTNTGYAPPQMPSPQVINYNQPPPPVHVPPPSYTPASVTPAQTNVTPVHFQTSQPPRQQQNIVQKSYQDKRSMSQSQSNHMQRKNQNQSQQFARPPEKRASNLNIKQVPVKQPRIENQIRKNVHVNNSNIREIPLVDTLPTSQKTVPKNIPVVEEEDEKTKELRRKIEEQKLLREQILKRKEERRRQMAAQRLMDLKKRQAEQNKNVIAIQRVDQAETTKASLIQNANKAKVSVKERIGIPPAVNAVTAGKKKIVVVRKKVQPPNIVALSEQKKAVPITQRLGIQATKQPQKVPMQKKVATNINLNQNQANKTKILVPPSQVKTTAPPKTTPPVSNSSSNINKQIITPNASQLKENKTDKSPQNKKGSVLQRLGNRNNAQKQIQQRPPFPRMGPPSPRFNGPRTPQFQNPLFSEPRHRFPPPGPSINDMRMQGPAHFQEARPPLLPFHSPRDRGPFNPLMFDNHPRFRMQGPGYQNFRPMGMDVFPDRFPPPQFSPNQMPPMRQFEPSGQMFRQRFPGSNARQRGGNNSNQPKKSGNINRNDTKASSVANATTEDSKSSKATVPAVKIEKAKETNSHQVQNISNNTENLTCHSVSVENLSSSTSEIQLKKLCSSVGVVEKIQLIKDQRKAIIKFKEPSQALNFQKKYQRHMLDLAMIQVSLLTT
ncbi:RNA-binding protein 33 like protein [Argiope bruennichi]|uniref:RNA-binding protein 33 like protein n=1 Tax=Argiope bruennichi TaxID=94029 RepID=A0A8T0FEZ2_ARGBR|nr:RNA-binding protein 33 like protein [Argiope bruennichi]